MILILMFSGLSQATTASYLAAGLEPVIHKRVETDETMRGSQERVWAHVFAVDVHGAVLGGVARSGRQHLLDGGHLLPRERCRELHVEVHIQIALLVRAPVHRHSLVHDALPAVGFYHLARRLGHLETSISRHTMKTTSLLNLFLSPNSCDVQVT